MKLRHALPLLLTAPLLASGCLSSHTPHPRYYVLDPVAREAVTRDGAPLSVEIFSVRLPQYLERPQIVTRRQANQLRLAEYHQWGGNLRKNIGRVLARNLAVLLNTPHVSVAPHLSPRPADFRVELDITQFERLASGHVRLSAQWRLSRQGEVMATRIVNIDSQTPLDADDYAGMVSAMNALLARLSSQIARAITQGPGD